MYGSVLVATDGSDASLEAAREAATLTAPDGTLHALFVREELPMYTRSDAAETVASQSGVAATSAADTDASETALAAVEEIAAGADLECDTLTDDGVPAQVIAAQADAVDADAVVLGKRGQGAAATEILGSTTERVLQQTDRTVVAVAAGE